MCPPTQSPDCGLDSRRYLPGTSTFGMAAGGGLDHTPRGLQSSEATGTAAVDAEAVVWGGVLSVWGLSVSKTPSLLPPP